MKFNKLFSVLAMSVLTLSLSATATTSVKLTVKSNSNTADVLKLYEDATTQLDEDMYNSVNKLSINMFAVISSKSYSTVQQASIKDLEIEFDANEVANEVYTITFSNVTGTQYYLKDNMVKSLVDPTKDSLTAIANNGTYVFTQTAGTDVVRFAIVDNATPFYPREIASGKWGTICYEEAISSVEGATVYEFKGKDATRVQVGTVTFPLTAGKAYVFNATADAQKFFYTDATKATQVTANNGLIGKFTEYTTTADDADAYVIKGTSLVPAAVGSTVPANRAYVQKLSDIEGSIIPGAPGRRIFNIVGTTTDLEAAEAAGMQDGKMMINGQLIIIKGGKMFNAQGAAL